MDRTHLKFFTPGAEKLAETAGLKPERAVSWIVPLTENQQALKEKLVAMGVKGNRLEAYQYKVCMRK